MENYKKLLEKAQKAYKNCVTGAEKRRLESIFPELKENEDEMIREEIVDYLKDFIQHTDLDLVRKSKVWIDLLKILLIKEKFLMVIIHSMNFITIGCFIMPHSSIYFPKIGCTKVRNTTMVKNALAEVGL